ncbi:hypothetical protein Tco_0128877 [Tanacetum coccineum]
MSAAVARGHGGDGGGNDPSRPPPRPIGTSCRGVGGRKATRGGSRDVGSKGVRKETRNLRLKKCVDEYGPLKNWFEYNDKGTMLHLGENAARWSNLVDELVKEFPMYYPSWHSIEESKRAHIMGWLMQHFDLAPHMRSKYWTDIKKRIEHHFAKIDFWLDPKHAARAAQNAQNRAKSKDEAWVQYPRGTYIDAEIDEMLASRAKTIDEAKEEAKRTRRDLELLMRVVTSDTGCPNCLTQLGSQSEIGGGSGSRGGGGGDDEPSGDEDAGGDDDI